ncbi:hypothetical protein APUTEX25_003922 [Auxenochlorella protothecoides]|uniref:Uncharacterized protein n=1 Tax=Auxenochlorella protothecoides TaxID=3075 RepID=A0A3M7KTC3_AUXPR|nr:hypothetical protein APUTEX25_003922 [Auxenochlorella protothecoides]|eukprot:RMZ53783.1 hypothetical protein APUTEX25_003922 [Auxenochlorella protothecoides]
MQAWREAWVSAQQQQQQGLGHGGPALGHGTPGAQAALGTGGHHGMQARAQQGALPLGAAPGAGAGYAGAGQRPGLGGSPGVLPPPQAQQQQQQGPGLPSSWGAAGEEAAAARSAAAAAQQQLGRGRLAAGLEAANPATAPGGAGATPMQRQLSPMDVQGMGLGRRGPGPPFGAAGPPLDLGPGGADPGALQRASALQHLGKLSRHLEARTVPTTNRS